ncbi:hypothetical protein CgunFtcFv8_027610, partial [Champsocephalus gunnari]
KVRLRSKPHQKGRVPSGLGGSGPINVSSDGALPNRNDPKPRVSPTDQDPTEGRVNKPHQKGRVPSGLGGQGLTNVSSEGALLSWKNPKPRVSPTDRDPTKGTQALSY